MIVICGAGVAGLCLANILEHLGENYLILEKEPAIRADGAGIVLHHNALCILESLNLSQFLRGISLQSLQLHAGRSRQTIPFRMEAAPRALSVHRESLIQALLQNIPPSRIRCNVQVQSLQCEGDNVLVKTLAENISGRMAIVANGARSHLHGTPQFRTSGQWCWRSIVTNDDNQRHGNEHWFGRHRLGVLPVTAEKAYIFHVMQDANDDDEHAHLQWLHQHKHLKPFNHLHWEDAEWLSHPLDERMINWGEGNRVAIGDAAHAMTPNMGLGAAMAMEDAWSLAELIRQGDQSTPMARQLAARRHKRVRAIQRQSWQIGQLAHWQSTPLVTLRNTLLRVTPSGFLSRQQRRLMLAYTDKMQSIRI